MYLFHHALSKISEVMSCGTHVSILPWMRMPYLLKFPVKLYLFFSWFLADPPPCRSQWVIPLPIPSMDHTIAAAMDHTIAGNFPGNGSYHCREFSWQWIIPLPRIFLRKTLRKNSRQWIIPLPGIFLAMGHTIAENFPGNGSYHCQSRQWYDPLTSARGGLPETKRGIKCLNILQTGVTKMAMAPGRPRMGVVVQWESGYFGNLFYPYNSSLGFRQTPPCRG